LIDNLDLKVWEELMRKRAHVKILDGFAGALGYLDIVRGEIKSHHPHCPSSAA